MEFHLCYHLAIDHSLEHVEYLGADCQCQSQCTSYALTMDGTICHKSETHNCSHLTYFQYLFSTLLISMQFHLIANIFSFDSIL